MTKTTPSFPLLNEFKNWYFELHDNTKSAANYKTWMNNIYDKICPDIVLTLYNGSTITGQEIARNLTYFLSSKDRRNFLLRFLNHLSIKAKSLNSDWASAAKKYLIFISELMGDNENPDIHKKNSPIKDTIPKINKDEAISLYKQVPQEDIIFNHDDLLLKFKARFVTQERKNGNYAHELPMRDLAKNLNTEGFAEWVLDFLENHVKFIIDKNGTTEKLRNINTLTITEQNDVIVTIKGQKKSAKLYTRTVSGPIISFRDLHKSRQKGHTSEPLSISSLALDHDTPIFVVLGNIGDTVPNLDNFNNDKLPEGNKGKLFDEFKKIHESVEFTLMDQQENIKKGKSDDLSS